MSPKKRLKATFVFSLVTSGERVWFTFWLAYFCMVTLACLYIEITVLLSI
jgi:hypothetical protein